MKLSVIFGYILPLTVVLGDILSIDLGNQFFKVALVSTGKFEIVHNLQSKRKTPTAVSFKSAVRNFGDDALIDSAKSPAKGMCFVFFVCINVFSWFIFPLVDWCECD